MLTRVLLLSPVLLGLMALAAAPAQSSPRTESFGTQDEGITIIGYREFFPEDSTIGWSGSLERSSGGFVLFASIDTIPNGAVLTEVLFYVRDDDPAATVGLNVCKLKMDAASGHSELQECFANATGPGGTPGETIITLTPNQPITYHGTSGFPGEKVFSYFLRYSGGVDCAIRLVELHWRRQISPAPAAASFDDVPISHPYFRHIEALFDSGITAGCNETPLRFCPERPITRGEMAVFLTKALGLHWPWDAEP